MQAGPRQTIDHVAHPKRGEGVVVHENGPSFFRGVTGDPVEVKAVGGGANQRGSFLVFVDPDHGRIEAPVLQRGERHRRFWSPMLGEGWLVAERGDDWCERWEGDDGRVMTFTVNVYAIGTPDYARRANRTSKHIEMVGDESNWTTMEMRDGTVIAFRKGGPPPSETPKPAGQQMEMFAR